ncbi:MAG: PKD domain-containing protein [Nitrososphaera sp.]
MKIPLFPARWAIFSKELRSSSCSSFISLTALITTIAFLLCFSNVLIGNAQQEQAQQQQQLTSQPSAIQNGTATRKAMSQEDSFRLQIPPGWIINDLNNTGSTLAVEVLQGYGILAQLCPADQQQQQQRLQPQGATFSNTTTNLSDDSNVSSNQSMRLCERSQDQIIHIVRYPNLGARLGLDSDNPEDNNNLTPDVIQAYEMQKLQEAGYRGIRIVKSSDMTINLDVDNVLNNNTMSIKLPAKLAELTYSTNLTPNETKGGYFLSTATAATSPNLETTTGYAIFYEGNSPNATAQEYVQQPTMMNSGSMILEPLTPIRQVFDSFELVANPEAVQAAIAAQTAQATEEQTPLDPLTVEIDSNGTEGEAPAAFEFEADITNGTKPYTISWDMDEDGVAESNQQSFTGTFFEADTYDTMLTVRDATGQIASDTIEVTIEQGEEAATDEEEPQIEENSTGEIICDPAYVDTCIPPPPPNLTCEDVDASNFGVQSPDPHGFDDDNDGIGCESDGGSSEQQQQQPQSDGEQDDAGTDDSPGMSGMIGRVIDMFYNTSSR